MGDSAENYFLDVLSGGRRGVAPTLLRGLTRAAEPVYSTIVSAQNALWDRGVGVRRLSRPVVSVGNVTAGGTGKTPVVRWLCERLLDAGKWPAILTRGYKTADEPAMLRETFGRRVVVEINPSRYDGGQAVLARHDNVDVFVLDDGFQHRKLQRDFDLVLVNAAEPFGFGHVHPRGLLREPLRGLRRADAILITHADAGDVPALEQRLRRFNPDAPIYACRHVQVGLRSPARAASEPPDHPMTDLANKRVMVVSGIGDPASFETQIKSAAGDVVTCIRRGDHAPYTPDDVRQLDEQAAQLRADVIITTEKDWSKLHPAGGRDTKTPIWRVELAIRFDDADETALFTDILARLQTFSGSAEGTRGT